MGTMNDLLAEGIEGAANMLMMSLGDFSDADMLVRPTPGANHAAWQLGHLTNATASFAKMCGVASAPVLPPDFAEKYKKTKANIDDAAMFDSKAMLTGELQKAVKAMADFARTATPEKLAEPAPENIRMLAATLGHVLPLTIGHIQMHNGQFQVIRRKLGKPLLF